MASEITTLSLVLDVVAGVVVVSLLAYTAYWARAIRRSLVVRLYRRQALWTGAIGAIYAVLISLDLGLVLVPDSLTSDVLITILQDAGILMIFAWIDTSVLVARRADPLLRDSLRWSKLRFALWPIIIVAFIPPWYYTLSNGIFVVGTSLPVLVLISLAIALFTPFLSGAVAVPLSASRSKDRVLRRHMIWFGLFVITTGSTVPLALATIASGSAVGFLEVLRSLIANPVTEIATSIVLFLASYSLYRSARSLAPLNKLSLSS